MNLREPLSIDGEIRRASTLPGWFYASPEVLEAQRERVFGRSWQLVADTGQLKVPGQVTPISFLPGLIDEPLVLARDADDALHCYSNVCTHRANVVVESEGVVAGALRCRYHGRRFSLDGRFLSMPEFEEAEGFPSAADDLPRASFGTWGKLVFAALDPEMTLPALTQEMQARCAFLPLEEAVLDPSRSREYLVAANWALYVDNYLEGFHIPYVHAGLAAALDYGSYRTELFPWASLQVGIAKEGEDTLEPPAGSPDHGQRVAGYYFWLFPNTMINVYPWGISVNIIRPLAVDRTRVVYRTYVWDASRLDRGAGAALDRVEREDETVVESVQRGIRSRLYRRGRYSPARETGVHHFHRMLVRALEG